MSTRLAVLTWGKIVMVYSKYFQIFLIVTTLALVVNCGPKSANSSVITSSASAIKESLSSGSDTQVDKEGVVTTQLTGNNATPQIIRSSKNGENSLKNELLIPPGALSIDTQVILEPGANIAFDSTPDEFGLSEDNLVEPASKAIVVYFSGEVEPSQPLTLSIAIDSTGLSLASSTYENIAIAYHVHSKVSGKKHLREKGIIPRSKIKIEDNTVIFDLVKIGSYQAVRLEKPIEEEVKKVSETKIRSKRGHINRKGQLTRKKIKTSNMNQTQLTQDESAKEKRQKNKLQKRSIDKKNGLKNNGPSSLASSESNQQGFKISLNGGQKFTTSTRAKLFIDMPDNATKLYITRHPSCRKRGKWIKAKEEVTVRLGNKKGDKAFYARYRDQDGNLSECVSANITKR